MLPSMRVMVRLAKNNPNIHSSMLEPTSTNRSIFVIPVRCNGVMEALHPSTKKMLNRLLPITFPIAISGFFFKAATMEVASSGRDVPPATRVSPMTDSPYSQIACNAAGAIYEEITAGNQCHQPTYYI